MIPVTLMNFQIKGDAGFEATKISGSSLRGALYAALRIMYDTDDPVQTSEGKEQNPVGWLLRLEDDTLSGGKDVPRGLAIRPFTPEDARTFSITLYGDARDLLQLIVSAVPVMGRLGVGPKRSKFKLIQVNVADLLTGSQQLLWRNAELISDNFHDDIPGNGTQNIVAADTLKIHFLTPTRIVSQGHLCHRPEFRAWFQRLLERIRTISTVYTNNPIWIPFRNLLDDASKIHMIEDHTQWVDGWSGSRRDGMMKPLGGFAGVVTYGGDFSQLLPWIRIGEVLQVGKNTVKGCGWYRIDNP